MGRSPRLRLPDFLLVVNRFRNHGTGDVNSSKLGICRGCYFIMVPKSGVVIHLLIDVDSLHAIFPLSVLVVKTTHHANEWIGL